MTDRNRTSARRTTEVTEKPQRRTFTAEYKQRILEEAEACQEGELGALLRREGLYHAHLSKWRKQRDRGALKGLTPKKRGPKPGLTGAERQELEQLRRENQRLKRELRKVEVIVEIQKKASELLGIPLSQQLSDESDW